MNLVFMGTPSFAVPSLKQLAEDGHSIGAVVTAPEKRRGRGQKVADTPVGEAAQSLGLSVRRPYDLSDRSFHEELSSLSPDIIVVVAFRILPEDIFVIPSKGAFNLHASLLPRYRGAAPIQRAILNGDRETGVTTFLLEKKVDTGNVLLQERIGIGRDETGGELHDRLAHLGAEVVSRTVRMMESGDIHPSKQDDARVTYARKITKEDLHIDWNQPAVMVHNRVRAFSPDPGAWTTLNGKLFKVFRSSVVTEEQKDTTDPGSVIRCSSDACIVRCGEGMLALHEVMIEGRKRMPVSAFFRGYTLDPGTVLGTAGSLPEA